MLLSTRSAYSWEQKIYYNCSYYYSSKTKSKNKIINAFGVKSYNSIRNNISNIKTKKPFRKYTYLVNKLLASINKLSVPIDTYKDKRHTNSCRNAVYWKIIIQICKRMFTLTLLNALLLKNVFFWVFKNFKLSRLFPNWKQFSYTKFFLLIWEFPIWFKFIYNCWSNIKRNERVN